jgi:hypothetical protein
VARLTRRLAAAAFLTALVAVVVACSSNDGTAAPRTLRVPSEFTRIQDAVDAARPGDLVLVDPGVYREAVLVVTRELTIRGTDRNAVVLDGRGGLGVGVRTVDTAGVAVENLTVRNYADSGLSWVDAAGFRASHVTVYDNGRRGIDVFDSVDGLIEQVWTSGSAEAGVHVSQCDPCRIVVDGATAVDNGTGVLVVNAGRDLQVVRSTIRSNRAGVVLHSTSYTLCAPQQGAAVAGNVIGPNDRRDLPVGEVGIVADNAGIAVVGGRDDLLRANRVVDQPGFGIVVASFPELDAAAPLPDPAEVSEPCRTRSFIPSSGRIVVTVWPASGNRIEDNVVTGSGRADLVLAAPGGDVTGLGNCASGNVVATTRPVDLQQLAPCGAPAATSGWERSAEVVPDLDTDERSELLEVDDEVEARRGQTPPPQAQLPNAANAPAVPATIAPDPVDVAALPVPG